MTPLSSLPNFKSVAQILAELFQIQIASQAIEYLYKSEEESELEEGKENMSKAVLNGWIGVEEEDTYVKSTDIVNFKSKLKSSKS